MAFREWDTSAANNDDADATINWLEGMSPASVNNSARAMMAALAVWRDLIDYGTVSGGVVGGSANAVTLTCTPTVLAREAGRRYLFKYTSTGTTGGVTLVVDSLTSGAIQYLGAALVSGDIATGDWVLVADDGTNFQLLTPPRISHWALINSLTADGTGATGDKIPTYDVSATGPKYILISTLQTLLAGSQAQMEAASSAAVNATAANMQWHPGVGKARVKYDQSTGTATAGGVSYNLSSLTDGATGIATMNFTTAFADANYHPSGMAQRAATNNDAMVAIAQATNPTTTALALATTVAAVNADHSYVSVVVHGDQ